MAGDPYSRLVGILKVALPLIALALLSTLFLVSDRIEPGSTIPFADGEITERVTGQQVTGPLFSGTTSSGDLVTLRTEQLVQDSTGANRAENLSIRIEFSGGGRVALVSDTGTFQLAQSTALLTGNVLIESSTGYRMHTDAMTARLSELDIRAPGEVRATGPAGDLTAGAMQITALGDTQGAQLLFTDGVKLIYDPKQSE